MADNFGSGQNRVLDVKDRNLDNVVFQYRHPPLTSEWNLINQIGNEKVQNLSKISLPSGWMHVDDILQDASESDARTGCVNCSESYVSTAIKLFSNNNNYAIVNGWPILVQGYGPGSTLSDNIIVLDATVNEYNNFVFLEVWRELVGTSDPIYRYGNIDRPYSDNEIEWDVVGCETTKRVQIQYRIRSVKITSLSDCTDELFDNNAINPIGGRTTIAALTNFYQYGSSDPGLYIAGDGSETSMDYLNTVDGYVYAIPMFVVYRRNLSESGFSPTNMNRTAVNKESTKRSDRPDNKLADVVYKEDIIDLRHQVMISNDLKNSVDDTISKLLSGNLTTALKKAFAENGAVSNAYSGASTLLKVERLNSVSGDNIPDIGIGSATTDSSFKRRAFCNAELTTNHNVVQISNTGAWSAGTFTIASKVTLPSGTVSSSPAPTFFSKIQGTVTGVTSDGTNITIAAGSSLISTSDDLWMEFTFTYDSSSYGFKDVPKEFIEVNKNGSVAIATRDNDILLKYNNSGDLLDFSASAGETGYAGEITTTDRVHYCGGNYTERSDFGHELILTRTTNGSGVVNLTLSSYKYNQYYILGVKSVTSGSTLKTFNVELTSGSCIITVPGVLSSSVVIKLYTGSRVDSYTEADSFKFFEMSKQGKGIIDTYEMIMVSATLDSGKYTIDTGNKPIIKIATTLLEESGYVVGRPFIINASNDKITINSALTINNSLPVLSSSTYTEDFLPTRIKLELTETTDATIQVPVLVHSYVSVNEAPYNFYYKTTPYQGLLNTTSSSMYGKVIGEGPAVITSSGSGSITNYTYDDSTVNFTANERTVVGVSTEWLSYVSEGDYIRKADSPYYYRILSVSSDTSLILYEEYAGTTESGSSYEIIRLDIPNSVSSNIVDRLPALSVISTENITDYSCYSDVMYTDSDEGDIIMTSPKRKLQDPICAMTNDFKLGNESAKRGRYDFRMTVSENPSFKLPYARPYIIYPEITSLTTGHNKKVYQFYIFIRSGKGYQDNSDLMGRVYLMVVAGETVDTSKNYMNPFSNKDVVDIFELVGRPIIRG